MYSNEMSQHMPFPYRVAIFSPLLALVTTLATIIFNELMPSQTASYIVICFTYSFLFTKMANGERRQFIAFNTMNNTEIEKDVKVSSNLLFVKTIISTLIVCSPFFLGLEGMDFLLKFFLFSVSFLVTWHNLFKGLAGEFRFRFVMTAIDQIIEEKSKEN